MIDSDLRRKFPGKERYDYGDIKPHLQGGSIYPWLALKPGKPTILGYDKEKHTLLGGLPGHPAAALAVFHLLFVWLWKQVTGQPDQPPLEAL